MKVKVMLGALALAALVAGCESEQPMTRAGAALDRAGTDTGQALDRAGTATGNAADRAGNWVQKQTQ